MISNKKAKKKITNIVQSLRNKEQIDTSNKLPLFFNLDNYTINGRTLRRLRIILKSKGCAVPTCTMCALPNFSIDGLIRDEEYLDQVFSTLSSTYDSLDILAIYNNGNFFSENEISQELRIKIYNLIKRNGIDYLMVESLPQFIDEKKIAEFSTALPNSKLIVGIGFHSLNDFVREVAVNSSVTIKRFLEVNMLLQSFGYFTKAYLMVKPPFFAEREVIDDVLDSVEWLIRNGITDIALTPLRVMPNTLVHRMYLSNLYSPLNLNTLLQLMIELKKRKISVHISISNLKKDDYNSITPCGCDQCQNKILSIIEEDIYNEEIFNNDSLCEKCLLEIQNKDISGFFKLSIEERVNYVICSLTDE